MSNEVMTINDMGRMAKAFTQSGFYGYRNEAEAFSLMCIAQANGMHPAKAAERYHIIQGRPAMKADAMLSSFQEAGGKVQWKKRTDTECTLWLSHPQGGELEVTWNIARATKAGLTGKSTWKQFPAQMLAARCVSEGVRACYPACLCGMYTPEEVRDFASQPNYDTRTAPLFDNPPAETPAEAVEAEIVEEPSPVRAEPKKSTKAPKKAKADKRPFKDVMTDLQDEEPEAVGVVMKKYGYEDFESIPKEQRPTVYSDIMNYIKERDNG